MAPGSYVSIFGVALANSTAGYGTSYLPISIGNVSVSFDTSINGTAVSVPGYLTYISPGQVNVQVPWELQGAASVRMKVSYEDSSGTVYNLPLTTYSPALFEAQGIAASLDQNNNPISASNPVAQGQVVQLFANGLGPVTNQPGSGQPFSVQSQSRHRQRCFRNYRRTPRDGSVCRTLAGQHRPLSGECRSAEYGGGSAAGRSVNRRSK